ncbi:MAG: ABC transporter ATP-binding protein [Bacteroidota bacterium]
MQILSNSSMANAIIKVENIGKKYILDHQQREQYMSLRDIVANKVKGIWKKKKEGPPGSLITKEEFWALKNVSFDVQKGERVGIIGRNGAGKSTLLKVLSRITEPTDGKIVLRGRVASLLEVGTGFHPELSGRENIYLNGAILGMSRAEIKRKFDEIVAFAEVEKFLDTPVKRYSSGMYVRLAFAVAAHLEPEILVVDEVLAVGDAQFQKKCLGKMKDVSTNEGRTVLFVSHNMAAMQSLCNRGILMEKGKLVYQGGINETISFYLKQFTEGKRKAEWAFDKAPGNELAKFIRAEVRSVINPGIANVFTTGESLEIELVFYNLKKGLTALDVTFHLVDELGHVVFVGSTGQQYTETKLFSDGDVRAVCRLPENLLHAGSYNLSRILLVQDRGIVNFEIKDAVQFEIAEKQEGQWGWMAAKEGVVKPRLEWIF